MPGVIRYKMGIKIKSNGQITIPSSTAKLINLESGDAIDIVFSDTEAYLLAIKKPERDSKGIARTVKNSIRYFRINWKDLAQSVLKHCNPPYPDTAMFRIGEKTKFNGKDVVPIITRKNYAIQ